MFFIVFEWGRILENAMDKEEVNCNTKLCPNDFSVNVSIIAFVFCWQVSKNQKNSGKIVSFLKFVGKIQQLVQKRSQKNN